MRARRTPSLSAGFAAAGQLLCLAAVAVFLLGLGGGGQQRAAAATRSAWLGLSVAVPATVKVGDPFALRLTVTNQTGRPCALAATAQGTIGLDVRRDGARVYPGFSIIEPVVDLRSALGAASHSVAAGGSVSFDAPSSSVAGVVGLSSVSVAPDGTAVAARWLLNQPGAYAIAVTYALPGGAGECPGGSGTATVTVKVEKCAKGLLPPVLPWLFGGGLALGLPWAVAVLGRRRIVVVRAAAVTVCTALLGLSVPAIASADIAVTTSLRDDYDSCLATYQGNDPLNILPELLHIAHVDVVEEPGPISWSGRNADGGLGLVVGWNPSAPNVFSDGVSEEKCSTLYHELIHAYDLSLGTTDDAPCNDQYNLKREEVRGTRGENQYRENRHFLTRTTYSAKNSPTYKPLPPGTDWNYTAIAKQCEDLKPPPPPPARNTGGCSLPEREQPHARLHVTGTAAAAKAANASVTIFGNGACSTGDPHLTTFDGRRYDFQTVGEFVLAKAPGVEVQARQAPLEDTRFASVNSAVGLRVGADRLNFAMADGVRVQLNGADIVPSTDPQTLPGGGGLKVAEDGQFEVSWPDGTEARIGTMSSWGLSLMLFPSAALKGQTHGILGNYDGDPDNDPVTSTGAVLADPPDPKQLFGVFADSWRVTDATSLLPYPPGTNTATFTDRTFPSKPVALADLDKGRADSARTLCRALGVTDAVPLAACVLDVTLSGQPAFATSAEDVDRHADTGRQQPPPGGVVQPGGTLHDGSQTGSVLKAGQTDVYQLDLGSATVFRLADMAGEHGDSHKFTLTIKLDPPEDDNAPGFTHTSNYQWRVTQGGRYTLTVTRTDGDTGKYSFLLLTAKEKRIPMVVGQKVSGNLEARGRVDIYTFLAPATGRLHLNNATGCDLTSGLVEDSSAPNVLTPYGLCYDLDMEEVTAGQRYDLIVWSDDEKTGAYSFTPAINS